MQRDLILRLAQYRRVLMKLHSLGFVKVFSDNLGDAVGVSASLVRKDLTSFGIGGNKRGGYQIDRLLELLGGILGAKGEHRLIVVGCGRIGQAVMTYYRNAPDGIRVIAGFDVASELVTEEGPVPIFHISTLEEFVAENGVTVAVVTVPGDSASAVIERLQKCGVGGVLNFAPVHMKSCQSCIVDNINIRSAIENLFHLVHFAGGDEASAKDA